MSDYEKSEVLRFLYDKREALFNVRRDHEWKALFAVITLIAAVDAVLVSQKVCLNYNEQWLWAIILIVFGLLCIAYEFGVQQRNRMERLAMDKLYLNLCKMVNVRERSVKSRIDHWRLEEISETEEEGPSWKLIFSYTYMWAFWGQAIVLLFIIIVSILIPTKICNEKKDALLEIKLSLPRAQ